MTASSSATSNPKPPKPRSDVDAVLAAGRALSDGQAGSTRAVVATHARSTPNRTSRRRVWLIHVKDADSRNAFLDPLVMLIGVFRGLDVGRRAAGIEQAAIRPKSEGLFLTIRWQMCSQLAFRAASRPFLQTKVRQSRTDLRAGRRSNATAQRPAICRRTGPRADPFAGLDDHAVS